MAKNCQLTLQARRQSFAGGFIVYYREGLD